MPTRTIRRLLMVLAMAACLLMPAVRAAAADEHPAKAGEGRAVEAGGEGHTGHGEGKKEPGLVPDLGDPQTWYGALWVVIIFVVMLAILYPTAWKQVLAGLKAREQRIRNDIAEAEAAR